MVHEIKRIEKGYTYVKYAIRGEKLTEEEIDNIREVRANSTFGNDIHIYNNGCCATVTGYID